MQNNISNYFLKTCFNKVIKLLIVSERVMEVAAVAIGSPPCLVFKLFDFLTQSKSNHQKALEVKWTIVAESNPLKIKPINQTHRLICRFYRSD